MTTSKTPNMLDYEAERRTFHLEVPEYFNFATDVIGRWAQDPNRLAMMWLGQDGSERHISFTTFAELSNKAANAFAQQGIQKGDTILIMLPRIPEWWESVLALMKLGAIFIPCTTLLTPQDIEHRIHVAEAKGFITDSEGAAKLDQVRAHCPTLRHMVMIEPDVDIARREGWTSYHQIVDNASSSFTGPQTRSDDPCLVYFTSGTVGYPKMVLHTHAS